MISPSLHQNRILEIELLDLLRLGTGKPTNGSAFAPPDLKGCYDAVAAA